MGQWPSETEFERQRFAVTSGSVNIALSFLKSYENMGRAEVTLLPPAGECWTESAGWSACPLAPVLAILDGWHSDHTSVSHTARLQTRYLRPGRNQLRIEVLAPEATGPPQGENKFKLLAVVVCSTH